MHSRARCSTLAPCGGPDVVAPRGEHHAIHEVLEGVDRALVDLVSGAGDHTGLAAAVDLMTQTLLSHFAYEERQLVEPLTRHGMCAGQA